MHNLRHFYYQNKEKIWKVVLIIAFLLGIIQLLNKAAIPDSNSTNKLQSNNREEIYSDEENNTYISNQSAISGNTVTEKEVETINKTISKFLQYCKNGNTEEAYNMLSNDCKEELYTSKEEFQKEYISSTFNLASIYEIEKWINNTYKVSISRDPLTTGDITDNEKQVDYITIVKDGIEEKLNVNSYIGSKKIDEEVTQNEIKIEVLNKKIYMDYALYEFKIENLSNKIIKLDSLEKTGTMYLKDANGNRYNAYVHEIYENKLEIKPNHHISLKIKYANVYSRKTQIKQIIFEDMVLDYAKYQNTENAEEFTEKCKLEINI